jgi:tyrosine-protein phosphatase 2/3
VRLHCRSKDQKRNDTEAKNVKLDGEDTDNDDYVNASYVQPLGTTRRYIATQGPLEATFNDFWR